MPAKAAFVRPVDDRPEEVFELELRYIGEILPSTFQGGKPSRFVVAADEEGNQYTFGAIGKTASIIGQLTKGEVVSVRAKRGPVTTRTYEDVETEQQRLHQVFVV